MNNFLESLKYTITTYNKVTKNELLKIYKKNQIAIKKEKQLSLFTNDMVEIDENDIDGTLIKCFQKNDKAVQLFEIFNVEKSYKYAILFKATNIKENLRFFDNIPDIINNFTMNNLTSELINPMKFESGNKIFLLFNKKYEAYHPDNGANLLLKYPIIVVFNIESDVVEFRFDSIKRVFTGIDRDQNVYHKLAKELIVYINDNYNITLKPISLEKIITLASKNSCDDIRLCTQHMNFKNGGRAQLKTGDDGKYIMPFIGELKSLMIEMNEELSKSPIIKNKLEKFITEKEITSEYPLAEIDFLDKKGIERRNNRVKFTFNYMNSGFCLISYFYNGLLLGMERMDDVTTFIEKNIM